ncbi:MULTISPECIES: hypothetical protein [unclassified Bradyrhizobium]|uniref:hypothetical protein n=1 Tax=unclassified Bradyrhizobium TaxID=2631580 RepID=UPI0029168990|nr:MULTISPECIES: hypothetical protein [unclassified Bradyrhizobium]
MAAASLDAVLSGTPGFTLLALVVALAAYLRQVSATARDKLEEIFADRNALWKRENDDWTLERVRILSRTRNIIKIVTHVFFGLGTIVGARVCVFALTPKLNNAILYWLDFALIATVAFSVFGMWIAHTVNRSADDANFEEMMRAKPELKRFEFSFPGPPASRKLFLRSLAVVAIAITFLILFATLTVIIIQEFQALRQQLIPHLVVIIGLAGMGMASLLLVIISERLAGPIEFESAFVKFKGGASLPILWVFVFLAMVIGSRLLWPITSM